MSEHKKIEFRHLVIVSVISALAGGMATKLLDATIRMGKGTKEAFDAVAEMYSADPNQFIKSFIDDEYDKILKTDSELLYTKAFIGGESVPLKRYLGFIGKREMPMWVYHIGIANLTDEPLSQFDIKVALPDEVPLIAVKMFTEDGAVLGGEENENHPDGYIQSHANSSNVAFLYMSEFESHTATNALMVMVLSERKPALSDLTVTIDSPQGRFEEIPLNQFNQLSGFIAVEQKYLSSP